MAEPLKLKPARLEPRADVIEILEQALVRARSGEMRGVVLTSELTGNRTNFVASFNDGIMIAGHLHMQMAIVNNAFMHTSIPASPEPPGGDDLNREDEGERIGEDKPDSVDYSAERDPD